MSERLTLTDVRLWELAALNTQLALTMNKLLLHCIINNGEGFTEEIQETWNENSKNINALVKHLEDYNSVLEASGS